MTYLERVNRAQRRRLRWPWLAAAAVLVLAVGGVLWWQMSPGVGDGSDPQPAAPASSSSAIRGESSPSTMADLAGRRACDRSKAGQTGDVTVLLDIGAQAADSTNQDVHVAGELLRAAATAALEAKGKSDEGTQVAAANDLLGDLARVCKQAGYA